MPNWKKIALSGSNPEFGSLIVDNAITASYFTGDGSALTNISATVAEIATKSDTFTSATTHSVAHNFNTKDLNVTLYGADDDIFIPTRINTPTPSSVVVYMDPAQTGRVVISKGGHIVSASVDLITSSTVSDNFTSATTHSVVHTFGTKDVFVQVYDDNDDAFIPTRISTPTTSSVTLFMDPATTGRIVIGKSGHLVSGSEFSIYREVITGVTSSIITHNLNEEYPFVQCYLSSSKEVFIPSSIKSVSGTQTEVDIGELLDTVVVIKR